MIDLLPWMIRTVDLLTLVVVAATQSLWLLLEHGKGWLLPRHLYGKKLRVLLLLAKESSLELWYLVLQYVIFWLLELDLKLGFISRLVWRGLRTWDLLVSLAESGSRARASTGVAAEAVLGIRRLASVAYHWAHNHLDLAVSDVLVGFESAPRSKLLSLWLL